MAKDAVARAVGRLESEGILDDAKFARAFARSRARRGYGPARVLSDLSRKGVERRVAEVAVAGEVEGATPIEEIARKKAGQLKGLPPDVRRRRLAAYLLRRGFRIAEVQVVLKKVLTRAAAESHEPA
jgi:regulatory protein